MKEMYDAFRVTKMLVLVRLVKAGASRLNPCSLPVVEYKGRQMEGNGLSAERLVLERGDTDPLSVAPLVSWHSQPDRAPRQRRLKPLVAAAYVPRRFPAMNDVPGLIVHSYAYFSIPRCLDQTEELRETMDDETVSGVVGSQVQRWDQSTWAVRWGLSAGPINHGPSVQQLLGQYCRRRRRPNVQTEINYVERLCKKGKGCMRLICRIWTHTDIWILIFF